MTAADLRLDHRSRLSADETAAVRRLVDAAAERDGVMPLSEHALLHLRYGGDEPVRILLAWHGDDLAGFAHLDVTDEVAGSSAELVVHPERRRAGVAAALVGALVEESPDGRLRLWAHGEHPGAAALAERAGFVRARALWQMRRSLLTPLPSAPLPDGVTVRTFVVGTDEDAWLALNNRAFAGHPEQAGWTRHDIEVREREPWFDPAGFFLAERDDTHALVAFHWTKVHGGNGSVDHVHAHTHDHGHDDEAHQHAHLHGHGHEPIGEVYVVGVDPDAQGSGLGKSITIVGLHHLRARGLTEVMLYVDESNGAAIRVYESLGFVRWSTDVSYALHR